MRALVKCVNNLAIQKIRLLANCIFHGVYDFVCGAARQSAALGYLGSNVPKKVKKIKIWMSEEQRLSMFRSIAAKSEQCKKLSFTHLCILAQVTTFSLNFRRLLLSCIYYIS